MDSLRLLNHVVIAALHVVRPVITKEIGCARGLATESSTALVLDDRVAENATLEGFLLSLVDSVLLGATESLTGKSVRVTLVHLLVWTGAGGLDDARVCVFVAKDIGVLVRSSCDLGLQRLVCKGVVTFVCKALGFLVVRLVVEGVTSHVVVVASAAVVVHDIVIGVAEHICVVLALLEASCFHLVLLFKWFLI